MMLLFRAITDYILSVQCNAEDASPAFLKRQDFKNWVEFLHVLDLYRDENIQMNQNCV